MHWNVCANRRGAVAVALAAVLLGCRADVERGAPAQTIVVRDASPSADHEYDWGERAPKRIEVVVADPRGGAGGPSVLTQLIGQSVKVQFRRDALGVAAPAPIPPTGQGPGGRAVHLVGTVRSVNGGWIVLERDKSTYWIPQASILMIEQSDAAMTAKHRAPR